MSDWEDREGDPCGSGEPPPLHMSEPEDCPTRAKNHAAGYRPVLHAEILEKPDDPETDAILHLCGKKHPCDIVKIVKFLLEELHKALHEEEPPAGEGSRDREGGA